MSSKILAAPAVLFLALCSLPLTANAQSAAPAFALHDGDRVTFYGDSITDQRQYTEDVEEYVLTRYPAWKVSFHNAGVGGDRVSGGGAGPIDLRLDRDVFAWHPDVITVMLGMNDFYYRPDQPGIYSTYTDGYRHLVESLKKNDSGVRITLIQPSPYDDVTRVSSGNNSVLLKYSAFVAQLAHEQGTQVADFNTPLTAVLEAINAASPALAPQVIPDRVHPQQGGHWIMAESLLKSWQAPSLVTSVSIDAGAKPSADAANTAVTDLTRGKGKTTGKVSWTQTDKALPLPFPQLEVDPVLALVLKNSDVVAALDQETLQVRALTPGSYDLLIDGRKIGSFTASQLANGINLATMETPMLEQARLVAFDTEKVNFLESQRFAIVRGSATPEQLATAQALADAYPIGVTRQRADAQPLTHHYDLVLVSPAPTGN
ncbi:MAG: SGNH/GDSL hydrolase family protein [Terracidiphilus sp.]